MNFKVCVVVLLAAFANAVWSQTNHIPGPQDYAAFSQFITDRNIFDPNRQPHYYTNAVRVHRRPRSAPAIRFVGTMSYDKGMFAFFSGNSSDLSKVLQVGDKFLQYTVTGMCSSNVVLEGTNQTQLALGVGDGLKEENGVWVSADPSDMGPAAATPEADGSPGSDSSVAEPAAPPSSSEPNEILKRLMQQREKENQ